MQPWLETVPGQPVRQAHCLSPALGTKFWNQGVVYNWSQASLA